MKLTRTNKKGFTIVELVIVIAVIAILAAVLIPNLSRLVDKANESKAMQQAKAAYDSYLIDDTKDANGKTNAERIGTDKLCIKSGDFYFHVENGQISKVETTHTDDGFTKLNVSANGVLETVGSTEPSQP